MAINYPKKAIDRTGCFQKIREPPSDSGKIALNNIHTYIKYYSNSKNFFNHNIRRKRNEKKFSGLRVPTAELYRL